MVNVYHWRATFTIGGERCPGMVQATRLYYPWKTLTQNMDTVVAFVQAEFWLSWAPSWGQAN